VAQHPALTSGKVAVITGGASGIGFATAQRLAALGMTVVIADRRADALEEAARKLGGNVHPVATNVADVAEIEALREAAFALGEVTFLMNNAGIGGGGKPWVNPDGWRRVLEVNLFGVINGVQTFVPRMIEQGLPAAIVNTGSKQGITTPPGDAAYNTSKAGVRVVTEQLAHELRNVEGCRISAHLLIPGVAYTGMVAARVPEKPWFAWTADQVGDRLMQGLEAGEFYILCEDNETTREMDERRVQWGADDIIKNRPALSRWHPDYAEAFKAHMAGSEPKKA
jgi:NAD(P)-dependent dehydrogenase (short-subunit alcohol dehydrogenase family)